MAESINALNLNITAKDNFSSTLNKLNKALQDVERKGGNVSSVLNKNSKALENFGKTAASVNASLTSVNKELGSMSKNVKIFVPASQSASTSIRRMGNESSTASTKVGKLSTNFGSLTNSISSALLKVWAITGGLRGIADVISSGIASSMEFVETLNLFTVTMGEFGDSARQYAETVSELMGIDPAQFMKYEGTFQALITGFGVGAEQAAYMSQNLTQLGYDIASFENLDIEQAMLKIQSGIAGELEPLRRIGYDLSQARLTELAQDPRNYGTTTYSINELTGALEAYTTALEDNDSSIIANYSDMSQMEKVQLRYLALMEEMPFVQQDMSRSLNDPSNATRVLRANLEQCSRAIGNIFIPMVNKLLPYLIATAQVIRDILNGIAALLGFELPDMSDRMNVGGALGGYEDIEDAIDGASAKAKKLKDYMIGLDELNVLRPDDNNGGSGNDNQYSSGLNFGMQGYDFIGEATNSKIAQIKAQIEDFLQSVQSGTLRVGEWFGNMFNKFLEAWENPFFDGASFGQAIADALSEANDFLTTSDAELLGFKVGEWFAGTIQGSTLTYELARFVINVGSSAIHFIGGFLKGVDLVGTTDSFLNQVAEALFTPYLDDLYGGHFENGEWVITDMDVALNFDAKAYGKKHQVISGIGDLIADAFGIGNRFDRNGNYVDEVSIDARINASIQLMNTGLGLTGTMLNALLGRDPIHKIIELEVSWFNMQMRAGQGVLPWFASLMQGDRLERTLDIVFNPVNMGIDGLNMMLNPNSRTARVDLDFLQSTKDFLSGLIRDLAESLGGFLRAIGEALHIDALTDLADALDTPVDRTSDAYIASRTGKPPTTTTPVRTRGSRAEIGNAKPRGMHDARDYIRGYEDEMNIGKATIKQLGEGIGLAFADGVSENLPLANERFVNAREDIIRNLSSGITRVNNIGSDTGKAFADGILSKDGVVRANADALKNSAISVIGDGIYTKMYDAGVNGVNGFSKAFSESPAISEAIENAKNLGKSVVAAFEAEVSKVSASANAIGTDVALGMAQGMDKGQADVGKSAENLGKQAKEKTQGSLGIHSPSKVFAELGKFTVMGFTEGFEEETRNTYKALNNFANTVKGVDTTGGYNPMANVSTLQAPTMGVSGVQTESMSNMALLVYEAVNTALQSNKTDSTAQGDTKIYINGREIFKVVQEESRKNGVAISNGAFIGG